METQASWNKFVSRSYSLAMGTFIVSTLLVVGRYIDGGHWVTINSLIGMAYYGKRWADTRAISS